MTYHFLLDIALILLSTKLLGIIFKRFHMPQVVGSLLAGLILGPAVLDILHETDFLSSLAELGVIVLMFSAGMETDIKELKNTGKDGFLVALIGVLAPLIMGFGLGYFFSHGDLASNGNAFIQNVFLGVVLTATSVSITVETLQELGKLNSKVGTTILAAALIDDILGLVALTVASSMAGASVNILIVLGKIVLFFVFVGVVGYGAYYIMTWYSKYVHHINLHRFPIAAFVLCLLMAYIAEDVFGVADIIGAFAAGLVVGNTPKAKYISSKFSPLAYLLLTPIFFASVGLKIEIPELSGTIILFTVLLIIVAVTSKLIGCGLGAKMCGFNFRESVQVGFGMVCRGEVTLIVANKALAIGAINEAFFGPIVIMVVFAAIFTPIFLKLVFKQGNDDTPHNSELVNSYEKVEKMDIVEEKLLDSKVLVK